MCSVTKALCSMAFVLITDMYKQLTRHISYRRNKKVQIWN